MEIELEVLSLARSVIEKRSLVVTVEKRLVSKRLVSTITLVDYL